MMKKEKNILILVGASVLLLSCTQALSRAEAVDVLDKIVLEVKSKNFEKPTSYNVTYHGYDNKAFKDVSVSFSFANTSKNHYSHRKTVTKIYEEDPKENSKAAYTVETKDEFDYIDPLATETTFISYVSVSEEKYSIEGVASTEKENESSFSQIKDETALTEWESRIGDSAYVSNSFISDITAKPNELDRYLKKLSSDQDTLVKESDFNSQGDGDLDVYIVTVNGESEESRTFKFNEYLIRRYEIITNESTTSASYSWGSFKAVYPDLSSASSESGQSSLN